MITVRVITNVTERLAWAVRREKAVATTAFSDRKRKGINETRKLFNIFWWQGENMKSKTLGLASANTGEAFKLLNELVEVGHTN